MNPMIVKEYIKNFERYGLGMFVHFGLYSVYGKGEWAYNGLRKEPETRKAYQDLIHTFCPERDWAKKLVETAKAAGCQYITLTTRHHDGFSLYDTCGLSTYDVCHGAAGRDLVREFVDACNDAGIVPFFYHTLLDWYCPTFETDFPAYLDYLRKSVALLCTRYGKIGGIWFDGTWSKKDADWEEDALYSMIRGYQPEAMIINNTGLGALGELGHIELDSVTFERGKPKPINLESSPKYVASEMCQIFAQHWGYAREDFRFKSLPSIIKDYCACRRYGSNFLLNVGPMGNGYLRRLDEAMMLTLGEWREPFKEALHLPRPAGIEVEEKDEDFLLAYEDAYYLFCHDLSMGGSANVVKGGEDNTFCDVFRTDRRVRRVTWLDSGEALSFSQEDETVTVHTVPYRYGCDKVVRVAKIELEA